MVQQSIPQSLRYWFIVHFIADMIFALPMMFLPHQFMALLGWTTIDELTVRLTGAALIGIGGQSLLSRHDSRDGFLSLLSLKIIWSSAAILGIILSILFSIQPPVIWLLLLIFVSFNILWSYYFLRLKRSTL